MSDLGAPAVAGIVSAIAFAFFSTWVFLSPFVERIDRAVLTALIIANVLIALAIMGLVGVRLWRLVASRRNDLAGSRTYMQLVGMFALVAVAPAIIAFLFAFTILRTSLNDVFSDRIERYQQTASDIANGLKDLKASALGASAQQLAFDIDLAENSGSGIEAGPVSFRQYLLTQAGVRGLAAILLVDRTGRIILKAELEQNRAYALPMPEKVAELFEKKPGSTILLDVNDRSTFDMFRGAMHVPHYGGALLVLFQPIDPDTQKSFLAASALKADWEDAARGRRRAESVFLAGYIVLALIIVSGAIWLALWAAGRLVRPIGRLIGMAERVSSGELGARVEIYKADGELGALARAMNHMTAQLQTQRDDLVETNRQFDRRRRFTEAVLAGVSAGVIGVSPSGRISIANRSASDFLDLGEGDLVGRTIDSALPEFAPILARARESGGDFAEHVVVTRRNRPRTVAVQVVADQVDGEPSFIVTFDDITQLIAAQRNAAWGDVARRIAHEIKNPLTPIQLSAERLRRKYRSEITSNPEIFERCTETIIRHVSDIGRMVDEFSSFARMPKPVIEREDLRELVRTAIFPQRVAFPEIEFTYAGVETPVYVRCDGRLIIQALSNLLKNAGESIAARHALLGEGPRDGRIRVTVDLVDGEALIHVVDNGVGLPKAERHRLTEPYMTTRAKGTGLGLAIVRKVIEEHGGALKFDDDASLGPTGARVTLTLPAEVERALQTAIAAE